MEKVFEFFYPKNIFFLTELQELKKNKINKYLNRKIIYMNKTENNETLVKREEKEKCI